MKTKENRSIGRVLACNERDYKGARQATYM